MKKSKYTDEQIALKLGPLGRRAAGLLAVNLHAPGGGELGELLGQVLAVG